MYIRRSFGEDVLYTTLVQSYIDTLLKKGHNFECFIGEFSFIHWQEGQRADPIVEGGRSRTGKLLPPKFGILSFVLDTILSGKVEDVIICPVSTQYDKVIETEYVSLNYQAKGSLLTDSLDLPEDMSMSSLACPRNKRTWQTFSPPLRYSHSN